VLPTLFSTTLPVEPLELASCSSCLPTACLQSICARIPRPMSDTCIVCLGDLGESASDPLAVAGSSPRPEDGGGIQGTSDSDIKAKAAASSDESRQIAHLLPCGHVLHNICLKPWVERANSCPICRQSFNVVELSDTPGGKFSKLCCALHASGHITNFHMLQVRLCRLTRWRTESKSRMSIRR